MLHVLHFDDAPRVQATAHLLAAHLDRLTRADHGERYGLLELPVLDLELFVLVRVALGYAVDVNAVLAQLGQYLIGDRVGRLEGRPRDGRGFRTLTLALRRLTSWVVKVSALAMMGMMLTLCCSAFMHSMSSGFSLCVKFGQWSSETGH